MAAIDESDRTTDTSQDRARILRAEGQIRENAQREIDRAVAEWQDPHDPGGQEMEAREREAGKLFDANARREFCPQAGQNEHLRWTEQKRDEEHKKGRKEGTDYGLNVTMFRPDGSPVYLDYADFKTDTIVDRKPLAAGESESALAEKYAEQREQHIAAYEFTTGRKVFAYEYSVYPSSRDIYRETEEP